MLVWRDPIDTVERHPADLMTDQSETEVRRKEQNGKGHRILKQSSESGVT